MKQVIVNGQNYLGILTEGEGKLVVEAGLPVGSSVTKEDIEAYFKAKNLGTLKNITFGGNGVSFSEVNLNADMELYIQVAGLVMEGAKSTAVLKLENREFEGGLGKF